jgi:hypothetical protein
MMTYRQWRVGYLYGPTSVDSIPSRHGTVMHLQYMDYCERYRAAHG